MATEKENLDSGSYNPSEGEGRGVPRGENRICKEAKVSAMVDLYRDIIM